MKELCKYVNKQKIPKQTLFRDFLNELHFVRDFLCFT